MEIYLIRHTTPLIEKGTCYGQADLDVTETFYDEASIIKQYLPGNIQQVYTSPLQRCYKLAKHLFPQHKLIHQDDLKEINCGEWELKLWDDIPMEIVMPWMNDFVNIPIPGGESYLNLFDRTVGCFKQITTQILPAAIVTHAGVMRSILSHITNTPLVDSFKVFKLEYGCVAKLSVASDNITHEIISNIASAAEQHKPAAY